MSTTIVSNHLALGDEVTEPPPVLSTSFIPPPKPIAHHGLLIQAINAGKSVVTVAGAQVKNPSSKDDTPGEFVVQGVINLWGNKDITAEFDVWHGSPPPGVTVGSAVPSVQRATIKGVIKLSQLIPSLKETLLGQDLSLQNVSIYHQNYLYDPTKNVGYDLEADLDINLSLGSLSLSSVLSKILTVKETTVHIHANLGPDQTWNGVPKLNTLTIEGSFVGH
ncbi:hypothetical protein OG21DRAFT_1486332, partial [Imleria badia]